jgi:hypothetical protein
LIAIGKERAQRGRKGAEWIIYHRGTEGTEFGESEEKTSIPCRCDETRIIAWTGLDESEQIDTRIRGSVFNVFGFF